MSCGLHTKFTTQETPLMAPCLYYIGLDVHKKTIVYCIMLADGTLVRRGSIANTTREIVSWAQSLTQPFHAVLEATMFSHRIHDILKPYAQRLLMAHSARLRAITSAKKKCDRADAETLANLLRAELVPSVWVMPPDLRRLRDLMRYRNSLVRQASQMKNRISGLLMKEGIPYDSKRLHTKRYFSQLLQELTDVPQSVIWMLRTSRTSLEMFSATQKEILRELERSPALKERVERLKSIDAVGTVTALVWALETGDPERLGSISKAQSYCGLSSALDESAGKQRRGPLSKQRNKYLQTVLIEAAKLAPGRSARLREVYDREVARGNRNQATIAVARKMVAYLLSVDKKKEKFKEEAAA